MHREQIISTFNECIAYNEASFLSLRSRYNENSPYTYQLGIALQGPRVLTGSTFSRNCYRFLTWRNTCAVRLMERALEMQRRLCSGRKRNANEAATGNSPSLAHQAVLLFMKSATVQARTHTRCVTGLQRAQLFQIRHTASYTVGMLVAADSLNMCGTYRAKLFRRCFRPQ